MRTDCERCLGGGEFIPVVDGGPLPPGAWVGCGAALILVGIIVLGDHLLSRGQQQPESPVLTVVGSLTLGALMLTTGLSGGGIG